MENYKFVYKRNKTVGHYICSALMVIFAIIWVQYFLLGTIVLGIGSMIIIAIQEGVEIDVENKKYRKALFIGNHPLGTERVGEWHSLSIKYGQVE